MPSNSSATPYGEWNPVGARFPIRYLHSLLQEIDFCAGEGYRRIPHGGLEVGGLLYGSVEDGVLTLVAQQPIECEHSRGPSFALSESDVNRLREQIRQPFHENEADLPVAGWFVSHCRGEMALTQQEVDLFAELFPAPHCVTLLVKPEKLKATQYGFLARAQNGTLPDRRCTATFLLPLTARPEVVGTAAVVAERPSPAPSRPASRRPLRESPGAPPGAAGETPVTSPEASESSRLATSAPTTAPAGALAIPTVATPTAARGGVWGSRRASAARPGFTSRPVAPEPKRPRVSRAVGNSGSTAERSPAMVSTKTVKAETGVEAEQEEIEEIEPPTFGMKKEKPGDARRPFGIKAGLAAILVIVLLLGVAWTYLNFMLRPIPLTAETRGGKLVITWPADSTAGDNEPWLEMWVDGQPSSRPLTLEEQEQGDTALERSGADVIVELRVHHWLYERRGMIRWIQVPSGRSVPPVAAKAVRR